MNNSVNIPRVVIAATQSGSGKTTLTCGILAALCSRGLRVQAYKVGPDYIDPGYLGLASGRPAHNLDTWLTGEETMRRVFAHSAAQADVAVIEGVMGLYDGGTGGVSSTAQIAKLLRAPVVLAIDCKSMGDSAAALALGFREYDKEVDFRGVVLNRLGSASHERMIREAMARVNIPVLGALRRDERFVMPERHLGLLPTDENAGHSFDALAEACAGAVDLDALLSAARSAQQLEVQADHLFLCRQRAVIAVARDAAFSFYYPESLAQLERSGAHIVYFSPLRNAALPECDGVILGGGFPEMFAPQLAANEPMKASLRTAADLGMPVYAECGGYMYLTRELTDFDGRSFPMAGLVPAVCRMNDRLQTVGYVECTALRDSPLAPAGTVVRGHEFHFSTAAPDAGSEEFAAWQFVKKRTGAAYAAGYACGSVVASYLHLHFAGNPELARRFVDACAAFHESRQAL